MLRLLRNLKPYRGAVAVVLVLAFLQSLANLYLPTLMADIIDNGVVKNDTGYIYQVGGIMLLITVGGALCAIAGAFFASRVA
ncbi:MAG TPA: ABC transporter ATP-binding protein, partial [Ktedonobacterales bacterium]